MSRLFLAGVLAVLLALLGVMANIVKPSPKEPEKAPESKPPATAAQQKEQDEKLKDDQAKLKEALNGKAPAKKAEGVKPTMAPPKAPGASSRGMQITSDWFDKRPDGAAGIEKLDKEAKEDAKRPIVVNPKPSPAKLDLMKRSE